MCDFHSIYAETEIAVDVCNEIVSAMLITMNYLKCPIILGNTYLVTLILVWP